MTTLVLDLPEPQVQSLKQIAFERGTTVNELLLNVVSDLLRDASNRDDVSKDPIFNIKAHETNAPTDLSRNVDHYLYGAAKR